MIRSLVIGALVFCMTPHESSASTQSHTAFAVSAYCAQSGPRHALSRAYRAQLRRDILELSRTREWTAVTPALRRVAEHILTTGMCS